LSANFRWKGVLPTNRCWCQSSSDCPFVWYQNIHSALFGFVTIHACYGQTDRQNCNSITVCVITCSRTIKSASASTAERCRRVPVHRQDHRCTPKLFEHPWTYVDATYMYVQLWTWTCLNEVHCMYMIDECQMNFQ